MVDPITLEIVRNQLLAAADDMRVGMVRSAFTPIIYEAGDCAVALLDERADVLAQSSGLPMFLGNLEQAVKASVELRGGPGTLREGDAVCLNDSYIQGTHLVDLTVFTPVFWEGALVGYTVARADVTDVGGADPGGGFATTEIYQEGLRMGPVLVEAEGEPVADILDIMRRNSRNGELLVGDVNAMVTACRIGEQRLRAVLDRVGVEQLRAIRDELFRQSERLDRDAVAAIPDGVYRARGCLDDDGVVRGEPVWIDVAVSVEGDRMSVDFTGTSGPVLGPLNTGVAQTISSVRVAYRLLFGGDRSPDGGSFRNLQVSVPEESFLNAREPVACMNYASSSVLLMDLIMRAFADVVPDRVAAGQFGDAISQIVGTDPLTGGHFNLSEAHAGGWGADTAGDGADGLIDLTNGSFRNTPVEVVESRYPVQVLEYAFRRGSGGAGRNRGGDGIVRRYRFDIDLDFYIWLDRIATPAWGLFGGQPGAGSEAWVEGASRRVQLTKANRFRIMAGEELVIATGGGGGYGDPGERLDALRVDDRSATMAGEER
jgi:N-methylhydantoinase B